MADTADPTADPTADQAVDEPAPTGPAAIEVKPGGPYLVHDLPLVRKRVVSSEHGEPLAWVTDDDLETRATYILCRCGGSASKPFCDGTHAKAGFIADDTAPTEDGTKTLGGTGIVVEDDRSICVHAGFCGNRVDNVWKLVRSGATDDSIVRAQVIGMVERCPSGALTYRFEDDGPDVEPDLRAAVGVVDDGPLWVTGGVEIELGDGTRLTPRNRVTLCRCGASASKPRCDGSHKEVGFRDPA